jgi:23S rRNA G2445 N2-methylase RlmL
MVHSHHCCVPLYTFKYALLFPHRMKGIGICLRGMEEIAALEVKELLGAISVIESTVVTFDINSQEELAKVCYRSQSLTKALLLLCRTTIALELDPALTSLRAALLTSEISLWLKGRTFKVHAYREGNHNFTGQDLAVGLGEVLIDLTQSAVSITKPDVIVYVYVNSTVAYIGIDFAGFDLSKRDYRVFPHPNALNATLAYALVRAAQFSKGTLLDPFCGSGTIPIEAALYNQGISPHYFKKDNFAFHRYLNVDLSGFDSKNIPAQIIGSDQLLKFLKATKTNAKLAGVEIEVTRMDLEWLDTKISEESVDCIVTNPPSESKLNDPLHIEKLYKEFFHQVDYILKKDGTIVLCVQKDGALKRALSHFIVQREFSIWQGAQEMRVIVLSH